MAFPTIPTVGAGRLLTTFQANTTSPRTFPNLSSLTKNPGDLLIAIIVNYQSSLTSGIYSSWGAGFTEIRDIGVASQMCLGVAYKISDGTETGTFTVAQAGTITGHAGMILMSIPGAHPSTAPEVSAALANGTAAAANPAALDPAGWATEDTLWIAIGANGETALTGSYTGMGLAAGPPTNYTNAVSTGESGDVIGAIALAVAFRQNATSSEDVGTWSSIDLSNARNVAAVIAVRPTNLQSVTLGLVDAGAAVYAPTVQPDQFVTLGLVDSGAAVYAPTVANTGTPGPTDAYTVEVLADSPRGYWRMGESSGNPQDSSGNANHVTTVLGTPTYDAAGALVDDDGAVTLDGATEAFAVPDHATLDLGDVMTLEAWVKGSGSWAGDNRIIVSKNTNAFALRIIGATGTLNFRKAAVGTIADSTITVPTTGWHHIVATKDGADVHLYIDAVDVTGTVTNQTIANNNDVLRIGSYDAVADSFFNGSLDEVAVYGTALSAARVLAHYTAASRPADAYGIEVWDDTPIAYFRMGEPSGSFIDAMGGTAGAVTGSLDRDVSGALVTGDDGAIHFDDGYVTIPQQSKYDLGDGPLSLEAWIKFDSLTGGEQKIIDRAPGNSYQITRNATTNTLSFSRAGVQQMLITTIAITDLDWHHIVATKNGSALAFYIDGVECAGSILNSTFSDASATGIVIGRHRSGAVGEDFDGSIDELAFYDSALTAQQVRRHYEVGSSIYAAEVIADDPIAYWRLGEPSGTTATAVIGPDGTYQNTPTLAQPGLVVGGDTAVALAKASFEWVDVPTGMPAGGSVGVTLEAWFKLASFPGDGNYYTIASWSNLYSAGHAELLLAEDATDRWFYFRFHDGTTQRQPASNNINSVALGDIVHVVVTRDYASQTTKFYVNGVELGTGFETAFPAVAPVADTRFSIGKWWGNDVRPFDGTIDEVAVYDYALGADSILSHYEAGAPAGPSTQSVTLGLVDAGAAVYAPTVQPDQFVTLGLVDAGAAVYAPSVQPDQFVTLGLVDAAAAVYAPTIQPDQFVTLGLVDASPAVYAPTVYPDQFVTLGLVDSGPAVYAPTVLPQAVVAILGLVDGNAAVYAPTIQPDQFVTLGLVGGGEVTRILASQRHLYMVDVSGIPDYGGYTETTDVWNAGTNPLDIVAQGPSTISFRSYGGSSPLTIDGVSAGTLNGLGSTGQTQQFALTAGLHRIKLGTTVDTSGSYALAWVDALLPSAVETSYPRAHASLNQLTPDISGYGGYAETTDVWAAGTKTLVTLSVGAGRMVRVSAYGGRAMYRVDGVDFGVFAARGTGDHRQVQVFAASGAAWTLTIVDPADDGGSYALAKVEVLPETELRPTVYSPTVAAAPYLITLGLVDAGAAVYAPSVQPDQFVTLGLVDGAAAVYAPTVQPDQFITVGLVDSAAAVYAPTVAAAPISVTVGLVDAIAAVYAPTVFVDQFVTLPLADGAAAVYAPTLAPKSTLTVGLIDAGATTYAPAIEPDQFITLGLVDAGATVFALTVAPKSSLTVGLVDAIPAVYAPTVQPDQFVTLGLVDSATAVYAPTLVPKSTLSIGLVDGGTAVYAPAVLPQAATAGPLSLVDAGPAVYALILNTGVVTVDLELVTGNAAVYAPTVQPDQFIAVGLVDAGPAAYALTLTVGAVGIGLTLVNGGAAVYAPSVTTGAVGPALDLVDSGAATYAPTVTPGAITATLGLVDAGPAVYAFNISRTTTLGLADANATVYAPTFTVGAVTVSLDLVDAGQAVYAPTVNQGAPSQSLGLGLVDGAAATYAPSLTTKAEIGLGTIDGQAFVYGLTVQPGAVIADLPFLDAGAAVYAPSVQPAGYPIDLSQVNAGAAVYAPTIPSPLATPHLPLVDAGSLVYALTIANRVDPTTYPHHAELVVRAKPTATLVVRGKATATLEVHLYTTTLEVRSKPTADLEVRPKAQGEIDVR